MADDSHTLDDDLKRLFDQTRDEDKSKLHNPSGGTVIYIPQNKGWLIKGFIKGKREIDLFAEASSLAQFGEKAGYHYQQSQIIEPEAGAPRSEWFEFYRAYKAAGGKITHADIAKKIGLSLDRTKHLYAEYVIKKNST